jgi:uracil-DNA glycosylase
MIDPESYFELIKRGGCKCCDLHKHRKQIVVHRGSLTPKALFIGEAPGSDENLLGMPFVGACGRFLNGIFNEIGLKDEEYAITNVNLCWPEGNRTPTIIEAQTCAHIYLKGTIYLLNPLIIVTLGKNAAMVMLDDYSPSFKVGAHVGKPCNIKLSGRLMTMIPMFHPSYIMRFGPDSAERAEYKRVFLTFMRLLRPEGCTIEP